MHHVRLGAGKPLLLIHGLGGSWRSWNTLLAALAEERDVIAVDLPGSGATPPLQGENSIPTLADACELFPDARLCWFPHSGHFPHWHSPRETLQLILKTTDGMDYRVV